MKKIAYVGVDHHLNHITIAVMIEGKRKFHDTIHMRNEDKAIKRYMKKYPKTLKSKSVTGLPVVVMFFNEK